jgi:cobaltochelatase CobT
MADKDNPVEAFRHALASATRALSGEPEAEVSFTGDAPTASGKSIKAPLPGRQLSARDIAEARGFADAAALKLRHHNAAMHARGAPADDVARAVFDAAEQARVEALGARSMAGVRANLTDLTEMRMRTDPLVRARSREEVPLSSAIGLLVRERLTGEAPPPAAKAGSKWSRAGSRSARAPSRRARARARRSARLRRTLIGKVLRDLAHGGAAQRRRRADGGEEDQGGDGSRGRRGGSGGRERRRRRDRDPRQAGGERGRQRGTKPAFPDQEFDESDSEWVKKATPGIMPVTTRTAHSRTCRRQFDYRAFTTRYDEVVGAS